VASFVVASVVVASFVVASSVVASFVVASFVVAYPTVFNNCYFSITTMVKRTFLDVTLHVAYNVYLVVLYLHISFSYRRIYKIYAYTYIYTHTQVFAT
jgi:hypothetical protein